MNAADAHPPEEAILTARAQMLQTKAGASAAMVLAIIFNAAFLMVMAGQWKLAVLWVVVTCAMVAVTRIYARYRYDGVITTENASGYIRGHMLVTATTGLVWSVFAISAIDLQSEISIFIASIFLTSISLGGWLPGSPHRGDYLVMATCALVPFGTYVLLAGEAPVRYLGIGYYLFYAVCWWASRSVDDQTCSAIIGRLGEEKRAQLAAEARAERLHYTDRAYQMASIGHDMAQPIIAQRHHLERLRKSTLSHDQKELISRLEATQSSQESMIDALMNYQRAANATAELQMVQLDLAELLRHVIAEYEVLADELEIAIVPDLAELTTVTDAEKVKRIVRNLLSNALKFTPSGGHVKVGLARDGTRVTLSVQDNGPGIGEADLARVFEPYVRLAPATDSTGLGLGLPTSQALARQLGGELKLSSEPGQGATFTLHLPDRILEPQEQIAQFRSVGPSPCLLILSDCEDHFFGSWTHLLSGWKMAGVCTDNISEAEALLNSSSLTPDILVVDMFKRTDDWSQRAVLRLRTSIGRPVPVILTAVDPHDQTLNWQEIENVSVVARPLHVEPLRDLVTRLLRETSHAAGH